MRLRFRHARQALRVTHRTKTSKHGEVTEEVLYAITSLPRAQAGARRLLTLHRGHWRVENSNHYSRDTTFREDASRMRTGHAPANNAALNNLALAIVVLQREPGETVPETLTRLTVRRERALQGRGLRLNCGPAGGHGPFRPPCDLPAVCGVDHALPGRCPVPSNRPLSSMPTQHESTLPWLCPPCWPSPRFP